MPRAVAAVALRMLRQFAITSLICAFSLGGCDTVATPSMRMPILKNTLDGLRLFELRIGFEEPETCRLAQNVVRSIDASRCAFAELTDAQLEQLTRLID